MHKNNLSLNSLAADSAGFFISITCAKTLPSKFVSGFMSSEPGLIRYLGIFTCSFSCSDASEGGSAEQKLIDILKNRFPKATDIAVVDISGGCGSMYEVYVEAPDFKGVRTVKQHQLVTEALKAEIPAMHGLRISTQISACS
eukprot:TCALIF_06339-PA protein Name:"Similar to Bola3 BolA-like protein 3 (Mus musculus)" AED:0.34 eAED:0.34 QI:0/0/0/0.33/1/1/3/0/141